MYIPFILGLKTASPLASVNLIYFQPSRLVIMSLALGFKALFLNVISLISSFIFAGITSKKPYSGALLALFPTVYCVLRYSVGLNKSNP